MTDAARCALDITRALAAGRVVQCGQLGDDGQCAYPAQYADDDPPLCRAHRRERLDWIADRLMQRILGDRWPPVR